MVVLSSGCDGVLRIRQAEELVQVEALIAQPAVDALDEGVLHRLARLDEAQHYPALVGPPVEGVLRQPGAVAEDNLGRGAALGRQPLQHPHHLG